MESSAKSRPPAQSPSSRSSWHPHRQVCAATTLSKIWKLGWRVFRVFVNSHKAVSSIVVGIAMHTLGLRVVAVFKSNHEAFCSVDVGIAMHTRDSVMKSKADSII